MKNLISAASLSLLAAGTAILGGACVDPGDQNLIFVRGALKLDPPSCEANAGTQTLLSNGVLDIGTGVTDANSYISAFIVQSDVDDRVSLDAAEVKFTTDVAQKLEGAATPGGGAKPRKSFVGGLIDPFGKSVAFVNTVTEDDARSLQEELLVVNAGLNAANPERNVRVIAQVSIEGHTTRFTKVKTPFFSFPIDLCVGCLTRQFADGSCPEGTTVKVNELCNFGQDTPVNTCE
jgi:hypothetical protein